MSGAAGGVDIHPIRVGVDDVGLQIGKTIKEPRRRGVGGPVGAVHQNPEPAQVAFHRRYQVIDIIVAHLIGHIAYLADVLVGFAGDFIGAGENGLLNLLLQRV
ncbi:hypothetical protein SDC9_70460 [bioreactor metagenome]|uniref:Uncharacterized protein n=1 Tax=bioreactor metagenome TaxID=1076179 RepID=A0A644YBQ8_9ZZZZ